MLCGTGARVAAEMQRKRDAPYGRAQNPGSSHESNPQNVGKELAGLGALPCCCRAGITTPYPLQ